MLLYLDNCCFNRPWDDQRQMKIHLETEAKLYIQDGIRQGRYELAWSYILDFENSENPYEDKMNAIQEWRSIASVYCEASVDTLATGQDITVYGIKPKDALHIACAKLSRCDYFITTDYKLTNKIFPDIKIINPIDFVRETEGNNENR